MKTFDFKKTHKDQYTATRKIKEVMVEKASYLYVDGQGEPGGEEFQRAIEGLYTLVYTAKFTLKMAKVFDFTISKLECIWPEGDYQNTPKSDWEWRLAIMIPDQLTAAELTKIRKAIKEKKELDTAFVKRKTFKVGRCLQVMHVGPYDEVGAVYEKLEAHAAELGLAPRANCHEIYISDPRRVEPPRLKTIVRMPVKGGKRR